MARRDIIVIGASAGGYEALKILVSSLPANLPASVFVVRHMSPEIRESVLPYALQKAGNLPAKQAVDGEAIKTGQIYVAPPDFHLLLESDRVRVTKGPKETVFARRLIRCFVPPLTISARASSALCFRARLMTEPLVYGLLNIAAGRQSSKTRSMPSFLRCRKARCAK
jgi:hypothetical protein